MSRKKTSLPSDTASAAEPQRPTLASQAKRASARAILDKIKSGKAATKAELLLVEEVEAEQASPPDTPSNSVLVGPEVLAAMFDVTPRSISMWFKAGMPRVHYGRYDVVACTRWWRAEIIGRDDPKDESLAEAKRTYWLEKAAIMSLTRKTRESELMAKADVLKAWTWRVAEVTAGLGSLASRLPPILEGKDQIEMAEAIRSEVRSIRDNYARNGRYTKEGQCRKPKSSRAKSKRSR